MAEISKRRLLLGAILLTAFGFSTATSIAATEIYDAKTRKWVKYDRATARKMFARNGQPPEAFRRQMVKFRTAEKPGTIIIDTPSRFLYLVQPGKRAIRYGIGVGRPGFTWAGRKSVTMKRKWPEWRPPTDMLKRRPDLPRYMSGGLDNPLGARALYLGSSLYRIHGTNEPHTIGHAVSSGCIRMLNSDVVDLYNRVKVGTPVVVI